MSELPHGVIQWRTDGDPPDRWRYGRAVPQWALDDQGHQSIQRAAVREQARADLGVGTTVRITTRIVSEERASADLDAQIDRERATCPTCGQRRSENP